MTLEQAQSPWKARIALLRRDGRRLEVSKASFLKDHGKAVKVLARNLERLMENPDEDAVHDTRTALRRVDAHIRLFPRSVRMSPQAMELLERHRMVMRASAKVRDLDVVRSKVASESGQKAQLLQRIDERRRSAAETVVKAVASARELSVPSPPSKELKEARLRRRFEKVVAKFERRIDGLLPVVAGDPGKLKELHTLRIDCKKLRYTLELAPKGSSDEVIALMERWQDALGAIHDLDVTTSYLSKEKSPFAAGLLRSVTQQRRREFRDFAESVLGPP